MRTCLSGWGVSIPVVQVFVDTALTICIGSAGRDNTFDGNAFYVLFLKGSD